MAGSKHAAYALSEVQTSVGTYPKWPPPGALGGIRTLISRLEQRYP